MKEINIKRFFQNEFLWLIPFIFGMLNLFGFGVYFDSIFIFFVYLIIIFRNVKLIFDPIFFVLLLYTIIYVYFLNYHGFKLSLLSQVYTIFLPTAYFLYGKYLARKYSNINFIYFLFFFLIFLQSFIPFISTIFSIYNDGFMLMDRDFKLIWTSAEKFSATLIGSNMALNMAIFSVIFVKTNNKVETKYKKIAFILFIMAFITNLHSSTRTGFFISVIALFSLFIGSNAKFIFTTLLKIFIIFTLIYFSLYITGIIDWIKGLFIYSRFTVELADANIREAETIPRLFRFQYAIEGLFKYPLGGRVAYIGVGQYVHNLWLDVGWKTGVFPLIPLLVFTFSYIKSIFLIIRNKENNYFFKVLILSLAIGFLLGFSVEPVMEGLFKPFCLWCFFVAYNHVLRHKSIPNI